MLLRPTPRLFPSLLALPLAALLAACGGQGSSAAPEPTVAPAVAPEPTAVPTVEPTAVPVATPEERVKTFFTDFSAAINDPDISKEATRDRWVAQLASYTAPEVREDAVKAIGGALVGLSQRDMTFPDPSGSGVLDVSLSMSFTITETRLVEEQGDSARVELVDGSVKAWPVGPDVDKLPPDVAAQMSVEMPLSQFFGEAGSDTRFIKLQRIDGVWYLLNVFS